MNIYIFEFKHYMKQNIIWLVCMIAMLFIYMSLFTTFSAEAEQFERMMEQFPEPFRKAMGLNNLFLTNILGYYGFTFAYISLIGSIFAMKLGIDILSKETREKTSDFLLVKPINRSGILISKILAVLTQIIIMNLIFFPLAYLAIEIFKNDNYNFQVFTLISLSLFLIQLFFLTLGVFLGSCMNKIRSVLPLTMGVVFGLYVLQLLNQTLEDVKLSYLTPFGYFDATQIIEETSYSSTHLFVSLLLSICFILLAYLVYKKKDIHSL
ncbi:ABC transporter permease subunit [Vallitalea okinawensis]|uniref:ABC transporter permease subunit n=1 Tax=Vallitalea okinawensis TaxID=2078660 RepID=UPI000CFBCDB6|nr:ABC transporter permease subunit [Vallitalea okinawensis]